MNPIRIRPDGSGDYPDIAAALQSLLKTDPHIPAAILLANGVYRERLVITRPHLSLIGEDADKTILTGSLYARMPCADIGKLGTFRTYSCMVDTHDFTASGITFENSAGRGPDVGQALALYADGDRLVFDHCRFLGGQDTLFTAPLPPTEREPHGFTGPGEHRPRRTGRHYYKSCYMEGDIDFIFGGAAAYFENCEFFSKDIGRPVNSFVMAASTPKDQKYGYVMQNCRFTGNCPPHSAYLGRPWREYAQAVLLNCEIGAHIRAEGWDDWNRPQDHKTVFFAEYQNVGPSSDMTKRPGWIHKLTSDEASQYTRELVLRGSDGWDPCHYL